MPTWLKASLIASLLLTSTAMPAIAAPKGPQKGPEGPEPLRVPLPPEPLGLAMEGYAYPHPVQYRQFTAGHETVRMAYMDVPPTGPANGRTVLLLHGKNFFGAYWQGTIAALRTAGYRVVVPDQLGFGKSSKPELAYSFHQMATETRDLLDLLKVREVAVVGHSMGGMLATRFALMFPARTTHLVLENPIGLEDYRFKVPYRPTEALVEGNLRATEAALRQYQRGYYVQWKPAYEDYVQVQYRWTLSGEYPRLARASALTEQMIYQQPVVHEFPLIQAPTLLAIGAEDRTVVGRNRVDPQTLKTLGQYPALARAAARAIPNARLELWPGVGHIPHFEAPDRFHAALLGFLGAPRSRTAAPTKP